jgi:hypothetical protein
VLKSALERKWDRVYKEKDDFCERPFEVVVPDNLPNGIIQRFWNS